MARRALLVGINDYKGITDLKGCHNDVGNMRHILKTYLGFTNDDIRVVLDSRATKEAIMYRLEYMVDKAQPGDYMVFHFSGHGSQFRDRDGDELEDQMDEILCPYEMNWDNNFILDDDLDRIFKRVPDGALLEVFLDCCHSGTGTRDIRPPAQGTQYVGRYLQPPADILFRAEGDEDQLGPARGFTGANRSGTRSTQKHVLWAGCMANQQSADANINGTYNGAFTYYFCKHIRESGGDISRRNLLERIRESLRHNGYPQLPQLECMNDMAYNHRPLQMPAKDEIARRTLYLMTPYMRGSDVKEVQQALAKAGYRVSADGVFGPNTGSIIKQYQTDNGMMVDGIVGPEMFSVLFK
jgi:hypothetical protein